MNWNHNYSFLGYSIHLTRIYLTFFLFFSISVARSKKEYLFSLPFTGNIWIIYIKITRSRWEKLLKVNHRGTGKGKFWKIWSPRNRVSSKSSIFPPLIRFRSLKTSPRRGSIVQGRTGTRSDGSTTEFAFAQFARFRSSFRASPADRSETPFYRGISWLSKVSGGVIFRVIARNRGRIRKLGKSFGKRDGGHFARVCFVKLVQFSSSSVNFSIKLFW